MDHVPTIETIGIMPNSLLQSAKRRYFGSKLGSDMGSKTVEYSIRRLLGIVASKRTEPNYIARVSIIGLDKTVVSDKDRLDSRIADVEDNDTEFAFVMLRGSFVDLIEAYCQSEIGCNQIRWHSVTIHKIIESNYTLYYTYF